MFKVVVDNEITLHLVHEAFVSKYVELTKESHEYISQWMAWPLFCKTEDDFKKFVKGSLHKYADGKSMNCSIEYRGDIVGNCGFNTINHDLKVVEIGYWLGEQYQGHGIITRACQYLIDYAFTQLGMHKIQISAAEENISSRSVCERLGMTLEGVITNREKIGERILNHAIYGLHNSKT
ncbi:GNAT family N-acetyltransferase [Celerinatantimonas yamalensis]|uniref:GNAT family N-acetyltransferase n=1 Tax=Celerinatantimonas yamalensis TaxID=559956 RepID=A0ABW9G6X4_9GAMM